MATAPTIKELTLNAATASQYLQKRYADLQILAAKLVQIVNTTHRPLSCKVISDYNAAVKDYLDVGNQIFEQLGAHKIVVEQIVYRDGVPVKDPSNPEKVLTQAVISPLRPAIFVPGPECPNAVRLSDADAPLGVAPAVAAAVIAGVAQIGVWVFRLGLAYLAVKALEQLTVIVRVVADREDPLVAATAFTDCVDKAVKSGVSPTTAAKSCAPAAGMSLLGKIGLVTLVAGAGVGGYLYFTRKKRAAAAGEEALEGVEEYAPYDRDVLEGFEGTDEDEDEGADDTSDDTIDDAVAAIADADATYVAPGGLLRAADFEDVQDAVTLDECPTRQ